MTETGAQRVEGDRRRPEIQALRAVAVMAIVIYHLWPDRLTGGYAGVDVFFVISGFLIVAHMLREVARTGTIALASFWARRIRRLLPAAFVVLAASIVLMLVALPPADHPRNILEIGASALYVENWLLAANAVDYLAATHGATLVQHYWSLSVEEQFYVVWPLVMVAAIWISTKVARVGRRRSVGAALLVVTLASFVWSIYATITDPAAAYFTTTTRAWEFGFGALLAFFAIKPMASHVLLRTFVSWAGLAAIVITLVLYTPTTPFPGYTALLPVVGTAAVIWAGDPDHPWSPTRLASFGPVSYLGDISYSLYLWHWPLIVVAPFLIPGEIGAKWKLVILAVAIILAAATKRFVEDPARSGSLLTRRKPRWSFLAAATGSLLILAMLIPVQIASVERQNLAERKAAALEGSVECFGAAAIGPEGCTNPELDGVVVPEPAARDDDVPDNSEGRLDCQTVPETQATDCAYGVAGSSTKVALVGDSHAWMWLPALRLIAQQEGWELHSIIQTACPFSPVPDISLDTPWPFEDECMAWNQNVMNVLTTEEPYDLVIVANSSMKWIYTDAEGHSGDDVGIRGFEDNLRELTTRADEVLVIRDVPWAGEISKSCYVNPQPQSCYAPREEALESRPDLIYRAAQNVEGVSTLDMSPYYCVDAGCPGIMGGVIIYIDKDHMSATYARTLTPFLLAGIQQSLAD